VVTLGELVMILDLARQGLSVSAIARRTGLDRKTIRKYIAKGLEPPAYTPRPPRQTLVGPTNLICESVSRLFRNSVADACSGTSEHSVTKAVIRC
jgi:transposase